jgi:hypothetical protein
MSRLTPQWTAGRLNEALGEAGAKKLVHLNPNGEIHSSSSLLIETKQALGAPEQKPWVIVFRPIGGLDDFQAALDRLPAPLAILSIDPEAWCTTHVGPGAYDAVGPFYDVASPLWEWLVRASFAGQVIAHGSWSRWPWHTRPKDHQIVKVSAPIPTLVHGTPHAVPPWLRTTLENFDLRRISPEVTSAEDAVAISAGLMEMQGFTRQSHELAQSVESRGRHQAADYWHAIHHRREPDPGNAKYWFQMVGRHPIYEMLPTAARTLLSQEETGTCGIPESLLNGRGWNPFAFVDLCQRAAAEELHLERAVRNLQFIEMTLLLSSTFEDATT